MIGVCREFDQMHCAVGFFLFHPQSSSIKAACLTLVTAPKRLLETESILFVSRQTVFSRSPNLGRENHWYSRKRHILGCLFKFQFFLLVRAVFHVIFRCTMNSLILTFCWQYHCFGCALWITKWLSCPRLVVTSQAARFLRTLTETTLGSLPGIGAIISLTIP